ncbi:MAG TPA: hypothetical protein VIY86_02025, partial [Pirellulaceae bacterium]
IEMTALVDPHELQGRHLVYLPWYLPQNATAWSLSDDEIQTAFWDGLRVIHPDLQPDDLLAFRISRVRHVMPLPTPHYSSRVPPIATTLPGLYVVNSSQIVNGTLNVNETVKLAEDAVRQLLQEDGGPLRPRPASRSLDPQLTPAETSR